MGLQYESHPSQHDTATTSQRETIYFAYGSNLSTKQMLQRCPASKPIGLGYLPKWRWIINERGYANVVKLNDDNADNNQSATGVYGLLYRLSSQDEVSLDRYEGVPESYGKMKLDGIALVRDDDKQREGMGQVSALVYVDDQRKGDGLSREEYVGRMERGLAEAVEDWGMSREYADMLREWLGRGTQP